VTRVTWSRWVADQCRAITRAGQWRATRDLDAAGPAGTLAEDGGSSRPVVSFASNDYLGLTQHPTVVAAAHAALDRWGAGSGAARLIVGSRPVHSELETELAAWKGAERALVFPTGFATNLGVLSTFSAPDVRVYSDELNHASIIDGCRLGRGQVAVYPHRDIEALERSLAGGGADRAIVVSDTVFSMDGDMAPVDDLLEVCAKHGALLVLDEAHAVLGPHVTVPAGVDVLRVGTLSKTLGSLGGFVAGPATFVDLLVNRARPFIFTTAPTPADTAAALAALRVVRSPEGETLRARLRGHIERIAPGHPSPIVPVVLGDERLALAASAALLDRNLLVPAIRPPTVAPGTSRLRIALSAAHTDDQVARLARALRESVGAAA
jgi:8-amino-7-oxononanoate synthase